MHIIKPRFHLIHLLGLLVFCYSSQLMADSQLNTFPAKLIKEDLHQLYTDLKQSHYNLFANITEQEYQKHYQDTLHSIQGDMSEKEIRVLFQRFVARGKVAHAAIDLPIQAFFSFREQGGKMLPIFIKIMDSTVLVDEYYGQTDALQPGTKILAINGQPIEQWIARCELFLSADTPQLAESLIEARFPFLVWLMEGEQPLFTLTIEVDQKPVELQIKALSREEQAQYNQQAAQSEPQPRDWKVLEGNIGWLKPGPFYNIQPSAHDIWDNSAFVHFVDEAMQHFSEQHVNALIIDVRNNPGGTNSFSDHLIAWIAQEPFRFASDFRIKVSEHAIASNALRLKPDTDSGDISHQLASFYKQHKMGDIQSFPLPYQQPYKDKYFSKPVFLLINRYSYSNAVNVAAILKDYGMATIIGEATTDLATTYGAMEHFYLRHTGIKVGFPKALIIRPNGDSRPSGVSPDIQISFALAGSEQDIVEMVRKQILAELNISD